MSNFARTAAGAASVASMAATLPRSHHKKNAPKEASKPVLGQTEVVQIEALCHKSRTLDHSQTLGAPSMPRLLRHGWESTNR